MAALACVSVFRFWKRATSGRIDLRSGGGRTSTSRITEEEHMRLNLSTTARDRQFGRKVRRASRKADALGKLLAEVEREGSFPEAILLMVTDGLAPGVIEEEPDAEGYFQVMIGLTASASEEELHDEIVTAISKAIEMCPLSEAERDALLNVIRMYRTEA